MTDRQGLIDGTGEDIPGHRILEGTDLEIAYNLTGDDLVLRVNKNGAQVLRVKLEGALKELTSNQLFNFNSVSPDFVFKIGDTKERMLALGRSVGLDAEQLKKLEQRVAELRL
jgi:hypothetical protein